MAKIHAAAHTPAAHATALAGLAALGVVFGDIGTSPLYVLRAVFTVHGGIVPLEDDAIIGVISAVIWILVIIVTLKYVVLVLRADNDGEGGIIALATLVGRLMKSKKHMVATFVVVGMLGAALFFGDSVITPAISVMSAIEGLSVAFPTMQEWVVVPAALVILTLLFASQRAGTTRVGRVFGPAMATWFLIVALIGLPHIVAHPRILVALSPHHALLFVVHNPLVAFFALGAIVLAVTGAEALYADIAHFGRRPIQLTWFVVVLPALILNYLGQGANLIGNKAAIRDPFFTLVPRHFTVMLVIAATLATVIASQAVISGAYSIARQASRLGFLPHMRVKHTSATTSGQIFMPAVNLLLYIAVITIVLIFKSSDSLSAAYGLAVTTDFVITSTLLLLLTHLGWKWPMWITVLLGAALAVIELPLFLANVAKIATGGWLPMSIAIVMMVVMTTWRRGELRVREERELSEGSLSEFLMHVEKHPLRRIPGTTIFPHSQRTTPPYALRVNARVNHVLHDHVIILSIKTRATPHVEPFERVRVENVDANLPGVVHLTMTYGFMDARHVVGDLITYSERSGHGNWRIREAFWLPSHIDIRAGSQPGMALWRKRLFMFMSRISASPAWMAKLPRQRTAEVTHVISV
ncbi:potassium transporter Kup [Neoactinobaculum massilliense]|uniref:potassium transporter Kup n=1 Tax=Neoactinobaculum massilliense TaxID=2364794 RepID=UPI001F14D88A|nr:KUP/HAK/KT family potassium transporter [Neoactinobaculum massilliense]